MEAVGNGTPTGDKLVLRGLMFHGYHGVKPEEKKLGQKFLIDVDAWMDLRSAGKSDNITDTISYTAIYRIVKEVVEGKSHDLLESVAQTIASKIFTNHSQISAVHVKVGKPHVAVAGSFDYLGIEIIRYRSIDAPDCPSTHTRWKTKAIFTTTRAIIWRCAIVLGA
ncbi:hypothetical protein V6N11_078949 [Hibiscus sabdariffa]|uniref:7,8-dihydroneopterin aldolase n=1 Tax=Hibiscus sabdariffa TaxID=183260 RepID=A0ABR2RTZ5_9ROSI